MLVELTHANLVSNKFFDEGELLSWRVKLTTSDKDKAIAEMELCIDIILILSNLDFKQKVQGIESEYFK
jgi:hypothetical protein